MFSALISDILCPEMTEQIMCFLLPSIADESARFPFGQLLESLLMLLSKADDPGGSNTMVTPTPWLLFGILAFVDKHLGMCTVTPRSDQYINSPYNFNILSNRQVMRIKEIIN